MCDIGTFFYKLIHIVDFWAKSLVLRERRGNFFWELFSDKNVHVIWSCLSLARCDSFLRIPFFFLVYCLQEVSLRMRDNWDLDASVKLIDVP